MASKRNIRRKNRKIKFSEDSYVERNYIKGSKAIIPVMLDDIADLYMRHDYKQMELSDDVCKYIEEIAYMIPINTDIVIEIHCPCISDEEQSKAKKCIKNNYGIEIDDVDYQISSDTRKALMLLFIGVIVLVINILTESVIGSVLSNFISVIWWVAIWYVVEIFMIDNNDNKWKRLSYLQLYDAKVNFAFDDKDGE